jgi:hypothetical protein
MPSSTGAFESIAAGSSAHHPIDGASRPTPTCSGRVRRPSSSRFHRRTMSVGHPDRGPKPPGRVDSGQLASTTALLVGSGLQKRKSPKYLVPQ